MDSSTTSSNTSSATVQHVNKKSSDELLRKFAQMGDKDDDDKEASKRKELRVSKRIKRSRTIRRRESDGFCESPLNGGGCSLGEKRSLLPPVTRRSALLRQLGIGKSQIRAREIRNKSLLLTIEKTWRKTVEGASKVFLEKHYNRHRRLINDGV